LGSAIQNSWEFDDAAPFPHQPPEISEAAKTTASLATPESEQNENGSCHLEKKESL
jgi:hypothetical protein